ncbi:MAG: hypothetical protein SVT56_12520 [Chloroflexota bacterium]|nr:hypothetical protein [Chloroflexota bacterium]
MNTTTPGMYAEAQAIIQEGWKTLVTQLGIQKATQFVLLLERGKGDSVQEIIDYWGDSSIEDIHNRVVSWKARQQSTGRPFERPASI